jgi:hypothetical protein
LQLTDVEVGGSTVFPKLGIAVSHVKVKIHLILRPVSVRSTYGTRNVWRTWSHFSIGCAILIYPEYMISLQYGGGRECILIGFTTVL